MEQLVKKSDNVGVFPASLRIYNGMGKYTTENNLTGIPRSVTDYDSFLLSRTKSDNPFRFVIHGYYFEIKEMGFASNEADTADANLYLHIKVENAAEYTRLVNYNRGTNTDSDQIDTANEIDNNSEFQALKIDNVSEPSQVSGYTIYTLRLTDSEGNLNKPSFPKIDVDSIGNIDGRDIGAFQVDTAGTMGFSQPIWFDSETGWDTVHTTFWGSRETGITDGHEVNPNGKTHSVSPGDMFFGL